MTLERPYRTAAGMAAVVLSMGLGVWLMYRLRTLLLLVLVAALIAAALDRPVNWVQNHFHLKRRGFAVAMVSTLLVLGLAGAILIAVLPFASQASTFQSRVPNQVERLKTLPIIGPHLRDTDLKGPTRKFIREAPKRMGKSVSALGVAQTTVSVLAVIATTLVAAIFLVLKGPELSAGAADLILDPLRRQRARRLSRDVLDAVSGYVVGNLFISLLASLVVVISLEIMRVPFVPVLAVIMFVLDLLPLVGATLGGAVVTLAAFLLDPHPWKALVFIVVFVVYQQIESHTLYPVIMSRTVKISTIAVFFVTLAGAELGGILGALLAIPAGAVLNIVIQEIVQERRRTSRHVVVTGESGLLSPDAEEHPTI